MLEEIKQLRRRVDSFSTFTSESNNIYVIQTLTQTINSLNNDISVLKSDLANLKQIVAYK